MLSARARARRFNIRVPKYQQIISALTWMSHAQNLRRVAAEHTIDLYLRPPVRGFRLMDYHLMERIVRDANRCRPRPLGRLWEYWPISQYGVLIFCAVSDVC